MKYLSSFVGLYTFYLLAVSPAHAGHCAVQRVQVIKQAVAVQQVVTPVVPVVAVQVPVYQVSYAPSPAPAPVQPQAAGDCCQQLLTELAALRAEIAHLRGQPPATSRPEGQVTGAGLLSLKCAECHTDGKLQGQGNSFIMFERNGTVPPFSLPERRRMAELVQGGRMPKHPAQPLSEEEKRLLVEFLSK